MKVVYAVEVGDFGERVYFRNRGQALGQGRRKKRSVFRCQLSGDAVIQLLNQQGHYIENETRIYRPKMAKQSINRTR